MLPEVEDLVPGIVPTKRKVTDSTVAPSKFEIDPGF